MEDTVKALEKKWAEVQESALKQPSPGTISSVLCGYIIYMFLFIWEGKIKDMNQGPPSL